MFEFIDFILKLWYNSPPENTMKIVACSGVSSGCFVYYVCKFLEKRKKSMGVLDEEKLNPDIKLGSKVRIVKKYKGTEFYYACRNAEISDECTVETIDDSNPSYRLINSKKDYCCWFKPSEIELVPEQKEAPKTVPNPKELAVGDRVKVINVEGRNELVQKTLGAIGKVVRIDRDGDHKVEFGEPINDWWYYPKHEIEFVPEVIVKEEPKLAAIEPKKEEKRIPQIGDTVRVNYPSNLFHHGKVGIFSKKDGFYCYRVTYEDGTIGDSERIDIFEFVSSPEPKKVIEEVKTKEVPKFKVGDYVKVTSLDFSGTSVNRGMVPDRILEKTGKVSEVYLDRIEASFSKELGDFWNFPEKCLEPSTLEAYNKDNNITLEEKEKTVSKPKFSVGDKVKIIKHNEGRIDNKCHTVSNMIQYMNMTGEIESIDAGLSFVSYMVTFPNKDSWKYSENVLELSSTTNPETKGETMEPTKWTLFSTEIPPRRDVVVSDDSKSWRYKTQEELKTEPKGTEPMKTETPKQTKIKLNWRPITNTEDLEDGESYFAVDKEGDFAQSKYSEDDDSTPSENFDCISTVAFYIPINEIESVIEFPTPDQREKVLKEEENQEEFKSLTMTDLAENFSSYSKEKQAEVVAYLRSKGIPTQV